LLAADTVDVSWRFEFNADYLGFEAFIASYMPVGTVPPLIRSGGRWGRPHVNSVPKEQLFVARDEEAKRLPDDGRWRELFERGFAYAVDKGAYDIPVMVTTFGEGLIDPVVIQMVNRRECPALSPNVFAPAHDFSLVGRDVRRGQEVSARARIVYRPIADLADVQALYEQFEDEDP
jgi:hypothetical protein